MTDIEDRSHPTTRTVLPERPTVVIVDPTGAAARPEVRTLLEDAGCRVEVSQETLEDRVLDAVRDADGIIFTGTISRRFMAAVTRCRVIARTSIGMDAVDGIDVATEKGIVLCNMPWVIEEEVADQTFALLLAVARRVPLQDRAVRDGSWQRHQGPNTSGMPRIFGATLGLVGLGRIGKAVVRRAHGFGMRIVATDPGVDEPTFARLDVKRATLGEVLQDSDIVSLHVPLDPGTHHLVGAPELRLMKRDALLVNTSRGPVVDEAALVEALQAGRIAGAGLDVMEHEPIGAEHELCRMSNVVLSPHSASRSVWTDRERHIRPAQEVAAVLNGHLPRAVWNPEVLHRLALR
ncbi:MAG: C-terminal binding protein [Candidatus Dormibacteraceae bacterium]